MCPNQNNDCVCLSTQFRVALVLHPGIENLKLTAKEDLLVWLLAFYL